MPKTIIKGKKPGYGLSIDNTKPKGIKSLVKNTDKTKVLQRTAGVRS